MLHSWYCVATVRDVSILEAHLSDDLFHPLQPLLKVHAPWCLHCHGKKQILSHCELLVEGCCQLTDIACILDKPVTHLRERLPIYQNVTLEDGRVDKEGKR